MYVTYSCRIYYGVHTVNKHYYICVCTVDIAVTLHYMKVHVHVQRQTLELHASTGDVHGPRPTHAANPRYATAWT